MPALGSKVPRNSRPIQLKVKKLYLVDGLSPSEIAEKVGLSPQSVSNLAYRNGWSHVRRRNEAKALAKVEDQARAAVEQALESVAIRTEGLVERGLDLAENAADAGDAKSFAMAAKGSRDLHAIWRLATGIDAHAAGSERAASLSIVFARFPDASSQPEEKSADPVEVSAREIADEIKLDFAESQ